MLFGTIVKRLVIAIILIGIQMNAQTLQSAFPVTNGQVNAISSSGTTVYLGGGFTHISPYSGTGVAVNTTTAEGLSTFPIVNGDVSAVIGDGAGGFYIGGNFTSVNGSEKNYIARINSDGTVHAFNPTLNGSVTAIALSTDNNTVYVAGYFSQINSTSRNRLAALTAADGSLTSWNPGLTGGEVTALMVSGSGTIYVGGGFTPASTHMFGDSARYRIAEISLSTGIATAWNPQVTTSFTYVYALAQSGSSVYIGGDFTQLNGSVTRNRVAKISKETGSIDASWNPNSDFDVNALLVSGNNIFVGGKFFTIGGVSTSRLAVVDTTTGAAVNTWIPSPNGEVKSLAISGSTLFVCGSFTTIKDSTRYRVAAIDVSSLASVNVTSFNYALGKTANAMSVSGTTLYVGGTFSTAGGKIRQGLAAVNGTTGEILDWDPFAGTSGGGVGSLVLSSDGSSMFVGGGFSSIGGFARNNLAKFSVATGNFDATWNPNVDGSIQKMSISPGDTLFFYGTSFSTVNGSVDRFSRCAAVKGTGTGEVTAFNPDGVIPVTTRYIQVSPDGGTVYLGYNSLDVTWSGEQRKYFAALNTSDGTPTEMNPEFNQGIFCSAIVGDTIFFGGQFTAINGDFSIQKIAKFVASSGWSNLTLDASWNNTSDTYPDGDVRAILYSNSAAEPLLYLGGGFHSLGVTAREKFGAIKASDATVQSWDVTAENNTGGLDLRMHLSTATQKIYLADLTNFSILGSPRSYVVAVNGGTDPLPVELVSFTALIKENNVELKWKTATEINNYGFEIEKKRMKNESGSMKWEKVGLVKGNGTTNAAREYSFTDKILLPETYSFRLKQIDRDGKFSYSQEVEVNAGEVPKAFALEQNYPNPFNPSTTVGFTLQNSGFTTLKIYDAIGREVTTLVNEHLDAGVYHQKTFDAKNLSSGIYFYRLQSGAMISLKKMTILK